jgi:hypothetical protein
MKNMDFPINIMNSNWSVVNGQFIKVIDHLQEMSGKSFNGAEYSWEDGNLLVSLSDNRTIFKIEYDNFTHDFEITQILQSPIEE